MQPIKLEIFLDDKTLAGMKSVEGNMAAMESVTRQVIDHLKLQLKDLEKQYKVLQSQGLAGDKEMADIQALQGAIGGLKDRLKEYEAAKKQANETPIMQNDPAPKLNSVKMSMQQIARELPALAMGPQMFFLAISNNIPMFTDAVGNARKEYERLTAAGQKAMPVWRQLLKSLISWQTAMATVITLTVVYGKEIGKWIKGLFGGKTAMDELRESMQKTYEVEKEANATLVKTRFEMDRVIKSINEFKGSKDEERKKVTELNSTYGKAFGYYQTLSEWYDTLMQKSADYIQVLVLEQKARKWIDQAVEEGDKADKVKSEGVEKNRPWFGAGGKIHKFFGGGTTNQFGSDPAVVAYNKKLKEIGDAEEEALKHAEEFQNEAKRIREGANISTVIAGSVEELESSIAERKKALKKLTNKADYDAAMKVIEEEEKKLEAITGKKNKGGKSVNDYQNELADARVRAQQKIEAARITVMNDGYLKRKAIANQEYKESIAAIDKEERDTLAKLEKSKKAGKAVTPEDEKRVKDDAQKSRILAHAKNLKDTAEIEKEWRNKNTEAWIEYNKEYGTYQEKRLAIEKEYDLKIAEIQENRRKAQTDGDAMVMEQMDIALAKATKDKGKALIRFDYDALKQSPDYIRAFENLKHTSSETLSSLLSQFEKAKSTAAQVLSPDQLREYTTTIQEIMDELDSRNPFQTLVDRKRELAEASEELAKAKKELDAVRGGARIETGAKNTKYNAATGKIESEKTYLSAAQALEKYNAAKNRVQKANGNFVKAEKDAKEIVDELSDAIRGVGDAIGGTAGEIIMLIGDVALFSTSMIDGITQVTKTGADAISAVEKASVILGIISTAIQLLQKMSELGNNKAFKQYEAYAEKIKEINALTDAVNQYKVAALEAQQTEANWFSEDNLKNLRDYRALHDEVAKAYVDKAMESQAVYKNESGGGWLTGAINWVMGNMSALSWWGKWKDIWGQGDYDKGQTAAINNLRIETRKKSSGFWGTGIGGKSQKTEDLVTWAKNQGLGDLFDDEGMINKELAQSLIDNYGNKLVGQTKETLEELIELREKYDEYLEELHDYVSSLYEPLVDNFVDSLWDWLDNGKDALSSFKDYASNTFRDIVSDMMRSIVLSKVVDKFDDQISELYEQFAKGDIDEQELMRLVAEKTGELMDRYESNLPTLEGILGTVNEYFKEQGIDLAQPENGTSQSGRSGAFLTMSQEQGTKLEGLFTSVQDHVSGIHQLLDDLIQARNSDREIFLQIAANTAYCKLLEDILELMERQERDGYKTK